MLTGAPKWEMGEILRRSGTTISENRWLAGPKKWEMGQVPFLNFQFWSPNRRNGGTISELDFGFKKWVSISLNRQTHAWQTCSDLKILRILFLWLDIIETSSTKIIVCQVRFVFILYDATKKL
jgi:hypothetical protein